MDRPVSNAHSERGGRVSPPAPLLAPAIGVMAGIVVSQQIGPVGRGLCFVAFALTAALTWNLVRSRGGGPFEARLPRGWSGAQLRAWRIPIVLGAIGVAVGFVRDQSALSLPEAHIAHAAAD